VWIFYALLSAFSLSSVDAPSKKVLRYASEWTVVWIRLLFASPFFVVPLLFITIPPLDGTFWTTIFALIPIELVAIVLYVKAIKLSPLSLSLPFLSLTPVFLILTGWLILGERVDFIGACAIGLIVLGAYLLHIHTFREGWLAPLRAIYREKGSRFMIVVAVLYSFTSSLGKLAILHSSPLFFGMLYGPILAACFLPVTLSMSALRLSKHPPHWITFIGIGFFEAVKVFSHVLALSQAQVAYMIAVKRTSLLFGMAYGYLLFHETHFRQRLAGSLLMLAGVALLSLR
jgi:drug/metabolite transporter (DMT)-like permease